MTLKTKFSASSISLVLVVVIGMMVSLYWSQKQQVLNQMESQQKAELEKLKKVFEESSILANETVVLNYIGELINSDRKVFYAGTLDSTGSGWYTGRDSKGITLIGPSDPLVQAILEGRRFQKREVLSKKGDRIIELSMPVFRESPKEESRQILIGFVRLGYSWSEVSALINQTLSQTAQQLMVVGIVSIIFGLLIVQVLVAALTRPIDHLMRAALQIAKGKKGIQIPEEGDDELTRLSKTFNRMSLELTKLDELKDDFISHVSHELRSPLTSIIATVELLREMPLMDTDARFKRQVDRLSFGSERLNHLVDNILDLIRMEAGKMPFDFQPTDIGKLLSEMADFFEPRANEKGLKISAIVPGNLPLVTADAEKIRQVISNLVHNAIKFTNTGGIILSAKEGQGVVRISVQDTGVGIPKDKLDRVFEKFETLKETRDRVEKPVPGSGLGLNIVKKSIEAHSGDIWVESEIDRGTTFHFTLPIARGALRGEVTKPGASFVYPKPEKKQEGKLFSKSEEGEEERAVI